MGEQGFGGQNPAVTGVKIFMKNNIYTCIEIGSYEIKMLVCNLREERLFVLTRKSVPSAGVERGQIMNFDKLVSQIKKLKEVAEADLKQVLRNVVLTIPPVGVAIEPVMGKINLDVNQPIRAEDVRKLFHQVMKIPHNEQYIPVGIIPRVFRIDENHLVQNPRDLAGMSLGIEAQRISIPSSSISNLVHAVETAGFKVDDMILGSTSETMLAISTPEMHARTCHINVGHGVTTLTFVNDGKVLHTQSLPIGGQDLNRELAEKFNITDAIADELKVKYGQYNPHGKALTEKQIIHVEDRTEDLRFITRGDFNDVITDWCDQLFKIIRVHLIDELKIDEREYNYSLAGGTAQLPNIIHALQEQLSMNAIQCVPPMLGVRDAKYASLVGVTIFAHELALLLGSNANKRDLSFETDTESASLFKIDMDGEPDLITAVPKKASTETFNRMENTQSLRNAIAQMSKGDSYADVNMQPTKVFGSFDDVTLADADKTTPATSYMERKLENSGMLGRFFEKIFNDDEA